MTGMINCAYKHKQTEKQTNKQNILYKKKKNTPHKSIYKLVSVKRKNAIEHAQNVPILLDHPAHAQSIIRAFSLDSYPLYQIVLLADSEGHDQTAHSLSAHDQKTCFRIARSNRYTVKKSCRFYGKHWQLAAGAFTIIFYGVRRTFTGISS